MFGAAVLGNVLLVAPAFAEPGKIFDFNATLPLMAAQFLLLMLVLDKLVYSPVGAVLDSRDAELRTKLESVRDTSDELLAYTNEANAILTAARNDAAAAISKAKAEADAQSAVKIGEAKKKLDAELKTATAALEVQRKASYAALDKEVDKLSASIVKKARPRRARLSPPLAPLTRAAARQVLTPAA